MARLPPPHGIADFFGGPPTDEDTNSIIFPFPTAQELLLKSEQAKKNAEKIAKAEATKGGKNKAKEAEEAETLRKKGLEPWTDDLVGKALDAAIDAAAKEAATAAHAATEAALLLTAQSTVKHMVAEMRPLFEVSAGFQTARLCCLSVLHRPCLCAMRTHETRMSLMQQSI